MIRLIRRIVAGLVVLFSLLPLWVAFGFFRLEVETWFGHPYYLGNDHVEGGCFWLLIGLAALLPGSYCALRRNASTWWLALGFAAALFAAVTLPSNVLPTMLIPRAEDTLAAKARGVATALDSFSANQGRFPADETELVQLAAKVQGPDALAGPYYRDGDITPVRLVYVGAASGPVLVEPPNAPMPTAIYCAVSPDRQRYWITVTMLDREVGGHPRWLKERDSSTEPMVISGSVRGSLSRPGPTSPRSPSRNEPTASETRKGTLAEAGSIASYQTIEQAADYPSSLWRYETVVAPTCSATT